MLILNDDNYYSLEANQQYMNYSQYKDWLDCEAMAYAKIWGGWSEPENEAFLIGKYVHSWSEGPEALEKFKKDNPELFLTRDSTGGKKGDLKADYKIANKIIDSLQADPMCMLALEGQKEVIFTAEFGGCMWKVKHDVYNPEKSRFADIKVMKSLHDKYWLENDKCYGNFIEYYKYVGQFAVYAEIEKRATGRENILEPIMIAVTKEKPPDKAIINFDNNSLRYYLEEIEFHLEHILKVKSGEIAPARCEKCEYCRETKRVTKVLHFSEL